VASGLRTNEAVLIVGFGLNLPRMRLCVTLLSCWWFFGLDTCGYSNWLRKEDERIASFSCKLFLYLLGSGPLRAQTGEWHCCAHQPVGQGCKQTHCNRLPEGFRHYRLFCEAFSEQRTKKNQTEGFLCLGKFPRVPYRECQHGKSHKEKLSGCFLIFFFFFHYGWPHLSTPIHANLLRQKKKWH